MPHTGRLRRVQLEAEATRHPQPHVGTVGVLGHKLRQDRILDEAKHIADPVHLMRVFGLTAKPAMGYVQAAHPERRSK